MKPHGVNNTADLVAVNEPNFFCAVLRYDISGSDLFGSPEIDQPFFAIVDGESEGEEGSFAVRDE